MKIVDLSVNRPVTILMLIFVIMFLGGIALYFIPVEMLPDITFPTLTVVTRYSNVAPEDVENMVTKPIEEAVSTVSGVKNVTSVSSEGMSSISVELAWGTNLDFAAQDMRDNIDRISEFLPEDIDRPVVLKFDPSAMPVLIYAIASTEMTPIELRRYTDDVIKSHLEQVEGVASAAVVGGREREIQVNVDREKLAAYGLSLDQLMMAIRYANLNLPAGHIEEAYSEYLVRTVGEFSSIAQLRNTVVKKGRGATIYLSDVADVIDSTKEIRGYSRVNKKESVMLMVSKLSEANTLDVAQAVKKKWTEMSEWLPEGFEYHRMIDQGLEVSRSTSSTALAALWGALFAIAVLYLFLRNIRPTIAIGVAIPLSIIATFIPTEFIPVSDTDMVMFDISLPVKTPLSQTEKVVPRLEDLVLAQPETETVAAIVGVTGMSKGGPGFGPTGVHEALIIIRLKDMSERKRTSSQVIDALRAGLPQIEGMEVDFAGMSVTTIGLGGGQLGDKPVEIQVSGPDWATLNKISQEIKTAISGVHGLYDIDTSLKAGKPELHVQVDRTQASERSLTVGQVATALQIAMDGKVATRYRERGDEIDVRVQFREEDAKMLDDIQQVLIASPMGTQVQLTEVAKVERATGPLELTRVNRSPTVAVAANLSGRDLGSAMSEIRSIVDPMKLPEGYFVSYVGEAEQMRETILALGAALMGAMLLMYMIMAALFESLSHPFTIMFILPLAVIGIILALFFTGTSISMVSLLGVLVLFGVIVNNGIVMIDYINQLRQQGMERGEAIVQGASVRLRPILITAFTTMLGLLPMAISKAAGSELRSPMAVAIIGGLFVGTLLTLIVVPTIYSVMDDISRRIRRTAVEIVQGEDRNSQPEDNIFRSDAKKVPLVIFEFLREHDFMFCLN